MSIPGRRPAAWAAALCLGTLLALLTLESVASAHATAPPGSSLGTSASSDAQRRGRALRQAIEHKLAELHASGELTRSIKQTNDVSSVVAEYLPAGTSLVDATAILRAAGCQIETSSEHHLQGALVIGGFLELKHTWVVDLTPAADGSVAAVRGQLLLTYRANADRR